MTTIKPPLPTLTLETARRLRTSTTDSIPPYVADFYCEAAKLVIELDGSQHNTDFDLDRTNALEARGFGVLRFWDNDVLINIDGVLEAIYSAVESRTLTPTPLPRGEGL